MKALWIVSNYPTPRNPTSGTFIKELAAKVGAACNLTVLVLVPLFPPTERYAAESRATAHLPDQSSMDTFTVKYLKVPYVPQWRLPESLATGLSSLLTTLFVLWWVIRRSIRPDLVHAHMGLNVFVGRVVGLWRIAPLVTTVNGSDINYGTQVRPGNGFRRWATLFGLRSSRRVIGISQALCQKVVSLGVPESRVVHIPDGFDKSRFYPMDQAEARRKLDLPVHGKILLSVGNLVPVKGLDVLIEAFGKCQQAAGDVRLYCVGGGSESRRLQAMVRDMRLTEEVFFPGRRPHPEVSLWMNACDLFVMSSRNEGWPSVLSEVLACGKPVVGTRVGGVPEIINEESLGELVDPDNPEALADAIDRNLQRRFDADAICEYAQQFDWSRIVPRVLEVYESAGVQL